MHKVHPRWEGCRALWLFKPISLCPGFWKVVGWENILQGFDYCIYANLGTGPVVRSGRDLVPGHVDGDTAWLFWGLLSNLSHDDFHCSQFCYRFPISDARSFLVWSVILILVPLHHRSAGCLISAHKAAVIWKSGTERSSLSEAPLQCFLPGPSLLAATGLPLQEERSSHARHDMKEETS